MGPSALREAASWESPALLGLGHQPTWDHHWPVQQVPRELTGSAARDRWSGGGQQACSSQQGMWARAGPQLAAVTCPGGHTCPPCLALDASEPQGPSLLRPQPKCH